MRVTLQEIAKYLPTKCMGKIGKNFHIIILIGSVYTVTLRTTFMLTASVTLVYRLYKAL